MAKPNWMQALFVLTRYQVSWLLSPHISCGGVWLPWCPTWNHIMHIVLLVTFNACYVLAPKILTIVNRHKSKSIFWSCIWCITCFPSIQCLFQCQKAYGHIKWFLWSNMSIIDICLTNVTIQWQSCMKSLQIYHPRASSRGNMMELNHCA